MTEAPRIHIFRAGRHVAMSGAELDFAEADIRAAAEAYDPAVHEAPLVVGHPRTDAPAYGWVRGLSADGGDLHASVGDLDADFARLVKAGRFRKVSASFYPPAAKANPRPGSYYLKHVGFLGAQPPAVKGLREVAFSQDEEAVSVEIAFGEASGLGFDRIARMFRALRDHFIEKDGLEVADRLIPSRDLDGLVESVAAAESAAGPAFSEPAAPAGPDAATHTPTEEEDAMPGDPKTLEARQAELDARDKALAEKEAAFAEREASARRAEDEELLDRLVSEGRMAPALRADALAFMEAIDGDEAIAFSEGAERTPRAWFRELLVAKAGKLIEFAEVSAPERGAPRIDRTDPAAIEAAALKHQKQAAEEGRVMSFAEAVRAVSEED